MMSPSATICFAGALGSAIRSASRNARGSAPPATFHNAITTPDGLTTTRSITASIGHDARATDRIADDSAVASFVDAACSSR